MRRYVRTQVERATGAAASLTGKRFGLLVASSLVATSAIVATALSSPSGVSPLAALVGRSLAADGAPPTVEAAPKATLGANAPAPHAAAPSTPTGGPSLPGPSPAPETGEPAVPSTDPEPPAAPAAPAEPTPEAGLIKHVFVVNLVSPGYEAAFGSTSQMPYLSGELRPKGELLAGYSLLDEGSLPNDLAAIAGLTPDPKTKAGCPAFGECVLPLETPTIADQLTIGRFTWHAYLEGMADPTTGKPDDCVYPAAEDPYPPAEGGYTAARNPFVFFHSLLDLGDCAANDVPLTELDGDLRKADTTADVVYVTPSLCNAGAIAECPAGQAGGPAAADAFLAEWAPKILKSAAFKADGLLVVAFNQLDPAPAADGTVPPSSRKVGALMVSRFLSPGATDAKAYDPYSLLRSIEDLFGLSHLAAADAAKVKPFASTTLLREGTGD
jgi:phosphatidylinositol-3-phosphatase